MLTCGFLTHHAMASWAALPPRRSAMALSWWVWVSECQPSEEFGAPRRRHRTMTYLAHFGNLGLALIRLQTLDGAVEEALVVGEARVLGDAVVVLARQQPGRQRRPDGRAVLQLLIQRRILDLEPLPVERYSKPVSPSTNDRALPHPPLYCGCSATGAIKWHRSAICVASTICAALHSLVPQ